MAACEHRRFLENLPKNLRAFMNCLVGLDRLNSKVQETNNCIRSHRITGLIPIFIFEFRSCEHTIILSHATIIGIVALN